MNEEQNKDDEINIIDLFAVLLAFDLLQDHYDYIYVLASVVGFKWAIPHIIQRIYFRTNKNNGGIYAPQ
ncbi:hypothetical protein AGMMS49944_24370 [Spirochaetia bacterium]|nr:hypothetical protein AGMMS49944_24370 [Spirochaetia bacterium]